MDWRDSLQSLLPADYIPEPEHHEAEVVSHKPVLTITLDRKRAGKTATIIYGFDPEDPSAAQLAKALKQALAVGGAERDGEILLQGNVAQKAAQTLQSMGYKTKIQGC